jgi:exonuclease III
MIQMPIIKPKEVKRNSLNLFHQNIRGLQYKAVDLICMLASSDLSPSVICISEHQLTEQKLLLTKLENYCLISQFSRSPNKGGGVSIYCKPDMDCNPMDITQYCIEKVIEACAARLNIDNNYFITVCIYRSPCGKIENFIKYLELILIRVYKPKLELIVCGDFNVNFLENSNSSRQIISLFQTYNLVRVVDFPTRITADSSTAIDSIFVDYSRLSKVHVFPVINGLSDHDAQYLTIGNVVICQKNGSGLIKRRIISESGILTFKEMLNNESWDSVFSNVEVNKSLNVFFNIF